MKEVKARLIELISYFHMYDLILFSAFLMLAMCFIFLSFIAFRNKFISIFCFLLGFCMIIAIPFAMRYFMQERFYQIDVDVTYDNTYNYSDVYQYIGTITNIGKRNIAGCVFSHQILYDTDKETGLIKYKHMLLNYIKPKKIYNKDIPMDLKVGQSVNISEVMENYPHKGEKYITKIECYGKKKHKEEEKALRGIYKPQTIENETDNEANMQSQEHDFNALEKELDSIVFDQSEILNETQTSNNNMNTPNTQSQKNITQNKETKLQMPLKQDSLSLPPETIIPPHLPQQNDNLVTPPPSQIETKKPDNWRELRDNFNPPLLKESPR